MLSVAAVDKRVGSSGASLDTAARKKIRKLDRALRQLREIEDMMPITLAHALLAVALNEGKPLQDLAAYMGVSLSNMSRYTLALSDRARRGGPGSGYGLVIRETDPFNLRKNSYRLSPKGRAMVDELIDIL